MKFRFLLGTLAVILLSAGLAHAAVDSVEEFLLQVQQRVDRGELSSEEALLLKFQYCFDRDKLPEDLRPTWKAPMKCATPLVREYLAVQRDLRGDIAEAIESYLAPPDGGTRDNWVSLSGKFSINYTAQAGHPNTVPLTDSNGNGVPDYVERIGEFLDYSYEFECNTLGFQSPPFSASYPTMSITLTNLSGVYGYTQPVSNPPGMTRIVMDNDFIGYAPNDDPEGDAIGAAKVTAAHEFKHSTQYAGSRWTEGEWQEIDATWMEDIAYPQVNDYLWYMGSYSAITSPQTSLDNFNLGPGGYEDAIWHHYMSQNFDVQFVVDFWNWRKTHMGQAVLDSYEQIFIDYGSSLTEGWNQFTAWNFATGVRWQVAPGYEESDRYPTGPSIQTFTSYPNSRTGTVAHLAANSIRCNSINEEGKFLRVTFDGDDTARMTLACVVTEAYNTGNGAIYFIELDANNDCVFDVPYDLGDAYTAGFQVGNANKIGGSMSYSITVEKVDATSSAVGDEVPQFAFTGNYPNPFNPITNIKFSLDGAAATRLDVYDVSGRKVRTLLNADLGAGTHTVIWDGNDDAGRGLASGTYFARLTSGSQVASHKLVLAK